MTIGVRLVCHIGLLKSKSQAIFVFAFDQKKQLKVESQIVVSRGTQGKKETRLDTTVIHPWHRNKFCSRGLLTLDYTLQFPLVLNNFPR